MISLERKLRTNTPADAAERPIAPLTVLVIVVVILGERRRARRSACCRGGSECLRVVEDAKYRLQEDFQIEPERPGAQVLEVEAYPLLHLLDIACLPAQAVHLRESSDARLHLVAHHVAACVVCVFVVR